MEQRKMKAYAMLRIGEAGWIEKDIPHCEPDGAILRPLVIAPCTTDIHAVYDGYVGNKPNQTLGHECVAQVVEVGSMVKDFKAGDKVIVSAVTPDWGSLEAQAGNSMHSGGFCGGFLYSNTKDGVFAEYFPCRQADANLAHLPENVSPLEATMLSDMIPPAFMTAEYADIHYGDTVLVIGTGAVGLFAIQAAFLHGAARVIATGSRSAGTKAALELGAEAVLNYKNGSIHEQLMKYTDGKGADAVCICGGGADIFAEAIKCLKPGGKIGSAIALATNDVITIPASDWGIGITNQAIRGGCMVGGRLETERLLSLLQYHRITAKPIISHVFHGWHEIETAVEACREKDPDYIKSVVVLDETI